MIENYQQIQEGKKKCSLFISYLKFKNKLKPLLEQGKNYKITHYILQHFNINYGVFKVFIFKFAMSIIINAPFQT